MKKFSAKFLISTFLIFCVNQFAFADSEGEKLYQQHCKVCHGAPASGQRRIAPPMFAVKNHYLAVHDEELTFIDAINNWVANPQEQNSLMKGAIRHFKLMPKIQVPADDVSKIAEYIFSDAVVIPEAYKKHYKQRHSAKSIPQYSRLLLRQLRVTPTQMKEFEFSDEQLEKLNTLLVDKEAVMQPMREEVLRFNRELQTLDSRKSDYKENIAALADVNAKRVEQMVLASGAARAKIEAVLNEKQYQMLLDFRAKLSKR